MEERCKPKQTVPILLRNGMKDCNENQTVMTVEASARSSHTGNPKGQYLNLGLAIGSILLSLGCAAQAVECGMSEAFKQRDGNAKNGSTSVWKDSSSSSLLFVESLNVNTDGTRRSYSVDDFWGEKFALNNLCNAMSDACVGLSREGLRNRRLITERAAANGWPKDELESTRISSSIIPFRNGKPCPAKDGYLISATALHKQKFANACDIDNYADALVTPAIVLPKAPAQGTVSHFGKLNAKIGDLVVAMVPESSKPVFAVVGDLGPANELGEGSIALNGKLLGKTALPTNYLEVRGKGQFKGQAWTVPKAIVVIFPGTRNSAEPFISPDRIDIATRKHFENWGGIERMNECAKKYLN